MGAMSENLDNSQLYFVGSFVSAASKGIIELLKGYELSSSSSSSPSSSSSSSSTSSSSSSSSTSSSSYSGLMWWPIVHDPGQYWSPPISDITISLSSLFPAIPSSIFSSVQGYHVFPDLFCDGYNGHQNLKGIYHKQLINPLSVLADLIVFEGSTAPYEGGGTLAIFDDNLVVNGIPISKDPCQYVLSLPVGTIIISGVLPGEIVQLELLDTLGVQVHSDGVLKWVPST